LKEAVLAVGAEKKVGWDLNTTSEPSSSKDRNKSKPDGKKVLTDAQKRALAKIRKP
jgi:hypothetical protein